MNIIIIISIVLHSVVFVTCRKSSKYPCNIYGNGLAYAVDGLEQDTITSGCTSGDIHWSYARGKLQLTFPVDPLKASIFRVCLQSEHTLQSIRDITFLNLHPNGQHLIFSREEYCTNYRRSEISLELTAPSTRLFRATIKYRLDLLPRWLSQLFTL